VVAVVATAAVGDAAEAAAAAEEGAVVDGNRDRVGLGWRPELAAGILANRHRIDVVEVIADDLFDAPARARRAMKTLARQLPVWLHGVGLGLASASPVDEGHLAKMARLVGEVEPAGWSEHLAFVRAGGTEIGHLAAPPRIPETVEGALDNISRACAVVGSAPVVENVATLIDPPGSTLDEASWLRAILDGGEARMLLDLHNLHANARNFGFDAQAALARLDLSRVELVHVAGGKLIAAPDGGERLLDDHLHEVPSAVYALLTELAARAPQPLTVILERDGKYPPFGRLLDEIALVRAALARGRARAGDPQAVRL
jgi:hypothetical protein